MLMNRNMPWMARYWYRGVAKSCRSTNGKPTEALVAHVEWGEEQDAEEPHPPHPASPPAQGSGPTPVP